MSRPPGLEARSDIVRASRRQSDEAEERRPDEGLDLPRPGPFQQTALSISSQ